MQKYTKSFFETYLNQVRIDKIVSSLKTCNTNRILEIGCGLHPIFLYYSNYKDIVIVEPSREFATNAFYISYKLNKRADVICGTFEEAYKKYDMLNKSKFDSIILNNVLHLVDDPVKFLRILKNVCKKSTTLHITIPNTKRYGIGYIKARVI